MVTNKTIVKVYGEIIVKVDNDQIVLNCDQIVWGAPAGAFGPNWIFGGDQSFEEANIFLVYPNQENDLYFYGRTAFNDLQKYMLRNNLIVASQLEN